MIQIGELKRRAGSFLALLRRWVVSEQSMIAETCLAALLYLLHLDVACVVVFVYIIALKLIISEDSLTAFLPFLLLGMFALRQYDSYDTFMSLKFVMGAPAVIGVLFHFIYYRRKPERQGLFVGYLVLSVVLALGGLFSISAADYFTGTSIYYTYGLGFGMLLVYAFLRPRLRSREYDIREYVAKTAFYCAVFAIYMVASYYIGNYELIMSGKTVVIEGSGERISAFANMMNSISNNLSTVILLTMPFVFYLSKRRGVLGGVYFAVAVLSGVAAVLTLSRGGMMFASAMCVCLIVRTLVRYREVRLRNTVMLGVILALVGVIFGVFRETFFALFGEGVVTSSLGTKIGLIAVTLLFAAFANYISYLFRCGSRRAILLHVAAVAALGVVLLIVCIVKWDAVSAFVVKLDYFRGNMMKIAAENFRVYPFFGTGMGYKGLQGIYSHKTGMFGCYHCLPVQIIGSLGLVGLAAYLFMFRTRVRVLRAAPDREYSTVVFLSYLGILYMSLVNPGIFCPLIYGVQLIIYFISAEKCDRA